MAAVHEPQEPQEPRLLGARLPAFLGVVIVACALAFGWVAIKPAPHQAQPSGDKAASVGRLPIAQGGALEVAAGGRVTVSVMTLGNELRPEQIAQFEALNPDIRIAFLEYSANLMNIMIATNDLPDVFRLGQVDHEPLVKRRLLLDVTERIAQSKVISRADMRHGALAEVEVNGRYYGLPQGLQTPDFASIYINKTAFKNAGMALPSLHEPLTYAELASIAKRLAAKSGQPAFYSFFFERTLAFALAQKGSRLFNDDFSEMLLTSNPEALKVIRYFYDLALSGAMHIEPAMTSTAFLFEQGELPMSQSGYWMGAVVTPAMPAYDQVTMLPPPVWDRRLPRSSAYLGGTRLAISAASRHPQQAYRFIEWYTAGKPAAERAKRGWGFPLLRSMEPLLPQQSEFDKQRLRVALEMLKRPVAPLPKYPYPNILAAFNQSWTTNMMLAKSGKVNFLEFASNFQEDVNLAIRDDMTRPHETTP